MVDLIHELVRYGMEVEVVDPWVDLEEAEREYGLDVMNSIPAENRYFAVVAAVAHWQFTALSTEQWQQLMMPDGVLLDLKGIAPRQLEPLRL